MNGGTRQILAKFSRSRIGLASIGIVLVAASALPFLEIPSWSLQVAVSAVSLSAIALLFVVIMLRRSLYLTHRRLETLKSRHAESHRNTRDRLLKLNTALRDTQNRLKSLETSTTDHQRAADGSLGELTSAVTETFKQLRGEVEAARDQVRTLDTRSTEGQQRIDDLTSELHRERELNAELSELRGELVDIKAQLSDTDNAIKPIRKKMTKLSTVAKQVELLGDRVAANSRQIGDVRYPQAPRCHVFFGHHKCGSRFFRNEVFQLIATVNDARVRRYQIEAPPFHYTRMDDLDLENIDFSGLGEQGRDVLMFANASKRCLEKVQDSVEDWKGLRIIRDPRQVLVSSYLHHKGDHVTEGAGWIWDQLVEDKPHLRELAEEDGILYELDHISREVIQEQICGDFDDERILTIRLEDFAADPGASLIRISEFLGVADIAGIDLEKTFANPESRPWQDEFTPRIREVFLERYGRDLIDLGYEQDMNW